LLHFQHALPSNGSGSGFEEQRTQGFKERYRSRKDRRVGPQSITCETACCSTSLANDDIGGGMVPGRELELEEAVQPTSCHSTQIERGGPTPTQVADSGKHPREHQCLGSAMHRIVAEFTTNKRSTQVCLIRDVDRTTIQEGATLASRPERLTDDGIVYDADLSFAVDLHSDRDCVRGIPVDKIGSAIEWVDRPTHTAGARLAGPFLPQNGIVGDGHRG
jgi:hypothetical protein